MDGRISLCLLTIPLALVCGGCVNTQKTVVPAGPTTVRIEEAPPPPAAKSNVAKRPASTNIEIGFGELKEREADSPAGKANPEAQSRLRDDARKAYERALQLDPNNLEAQRRLARLYVKKGDYERALDIYQKVLAKHPKDGGLWFDYGLYFNRRRDFASSVRCFTKALELEPQNRDYQNLLGYTLAWTGNIEQGLAYLTRAHGIGMAHYKLAVVFDEKDQREAAIRHCRLARLENGELIAEARVLLAALEGTASTTGRVQ